MCSVIMLSLIHIFYTVTPVIEQGIEGGGDFVAVQLPVTKAGEVAQGGANDGKLAAKKIYVSTHVKDENLPQILSMLDYLYTDEGILLQSYGVEGDTYTAVSYTHLLCVWETRTKSGLFLLF